MIALKFYSIQSKLSLLFITAGLIISIGGCLSFYFSGQVFFTTRLFITTTLPRIKTATTLQQTALSIEEGTQELSMSGQNKELIEIYRRLVTLLDNLEILTASISQEDIDIDILSLNWISQAIRTQSQLVFQMKAQQLRLIEEAKRNYFQIQRKLTTLPTFETVSKESFISTEWRHNELHNYILELLDHLHYLETAQTPMQVNNIEGFYKNSRDKLFEIISSGEPDRHEYMVQGALKLLAEIDLMFNLRMQQLKIDKSNGEFIVELKNLVKQLTQISTEYVNMVFNHFKNSARQVIQDQSNNLWIRMFLMLIATFLLYILYKRIVIRGFGDRLTLISRAMTDMTGKENEKIVLPTKGHDEIADMARTVEVLLNKAAKLKNLATIDELTQINNRRSFFEMATRERDRAVRKKIFSSIMMMDLDHFKSINDRFGHSFGDKVLHKFAQTCKKLIRVNDIFARYGGEEFVLLMPETSLKESLIVAERIRKAIEESRLITDDNRVVQLSVSLGLTEADLSSVTLEQAINRADDALYKAKEQGRNRVTIWSDIENGGDI